MENNEEVKEKEEQKRETKKEKTKKNKQQEEIIKLQEELGLEKEKCLRIQAEMINFKRRKEEETASLMKYANEDILLKLLSIIDNFERALSMSNEDMEEFLKGFNMIYTNLVNIVKDAGVTEIEALNQVFDPNIHQAVLTEKREGVEAGIVIEVLQKGYLYKDKVLRPTMVKVSE